VDVERSGSAHDHLLGGWVRHLTRLAPDAGRDRVLPVGRELLARYGEPHRAYHDRRHLAEVLAGVALLAEHADDLPVTVAAAWWHDAIYTVPVLTAVDTPMSGTGIDPSDGLGNEEASARLAERQLAELGVAADRVARVGGLVRMTTAHDPSPHDADAQVLSDADLSVLASPPHRYATYVADVRTEYAAVPDDLFRTGRAAILRSLLDHDRIFRTPSAHERWEADARANIAAELRELDA
jgi:predicted metal-dependent HD superfamily phosphohydrolase